MIPLSATGPLGEWLNNRPANMPGNAMDHSNILLVITPPDDALASADRVVYLPLEAEPEQLVGIIGNELLKAGNVVLIGSPGQFESAYQRWEWWAWCAPFAYDSDDAPLFLRLLESSPLPAGITRHQAREMIKMQIQAPSQ
ncbi:MAG: hypothetical protein K6L60_05610 [Oceanobacter sp.]